MFPESARWLAADLRSFSRARPTPLRGEISLRRRLVFFTLFLAFSGRVVAQSAQVLPRHFGAPEAQAVEPLEPVLEATFEPADSQLIPGYVPEESPSSPYAGAIFDRPTMFGNWWGARDALLE